MARKDYPFNKKDLNFGTNLISSLFSSIIALPICALTDASSSYSISENLVELNIHKLKKTHYICLLLFSLSPILFLFFIYIDWWVSGSLIVTLIYEFILVIPLLNFWSNLTSHLYIFNYFEFKKQVDIGKFILKLWSLMFLIHSIFWLSYNILRWWLLINFDWHPMLEYEDTFSLITYRLITNIEDSSLSILVIPVVMIINMFLTIYFFKLQRNFYNEISKNPTVEKLTKCSKRVDCNILCELFDRTSENNKIIFINGCSLIRILNSNLLDSGFAIIDKTGQEFKFCFRKYTDTYTGLLRNGNDILKKMAKDINHKLQISDIDYSIHNSGKNLNGTTIKY